MICIDNSEWMRNGDYSPSRFQAQEDAINLICGAKTQVTDLEPVFSFPLAVLATGVSKNEEDSSFKVILRKLGFCCNFLIL